MRLDIRKDPEGQSRYRGQSLLIAAGTFCFAAFIAAQDQWSVHDPARPQPRVVAPGPAGPPVPPPADAIVLFDGRDLAQWTDAKGQPSKWKVENGIMEVGPKAGDIRTGFDQHALDDTRIFDVEFAFPESIVDAVDVAAQHAASLLPGPLHADAGQRRIPDLGGAADRQAAQRRIPARIPIRVLHAAPLLRRAVVLDHFAVPVEFRGAEITGYVEGQRPPVDLDAELILERVCRIFGEVRIRALEIDVHDHRLVGAERIERRGHAALTGEFSSEVIPNDRSPLMHQRHPRNRAARVYHVVAADAADVEI